MNELRFQSKNRTIEPQPAGDTAEAVDPEPQLNALGKYVLKFVSAFVSFNSFRDHLLSFCVCVSL